MKFPPICSVFAGLALLAAPASLSAQTQATSPATNTVGPRMFFDAKEYEFGRILAGQQVKHIFIVTNTGDQTLEISRVSPGCHCTTAKDWTHRIAPGQTGQISIQFDSTSFRGTVNKTIRVDSNDKLAPTQMISLHGTIWKQLEVNPQFAYIQVKPGQTNATDEVHIVNQGDEPVTVSDPISVNHAFTAQLKTVKPGKEFLLDITAVPPLPTGNTPGTITVKTSLTNLPALSVTVIAAMQSPVSISPLQMVLPPRMDRWITNSITIANNENNPLNLSTPNFCCTNGVVVELKTITPGRVFRLSAAFPPGFQMDRGQQGHLTVKTDNPQQQDISVPVIQLVTPATEPRPRPVSLLQPPAPPGAGHP